MPSLAIHHRPYSFSTRWIEECKRRKVDCRIVDVYSPDGMEQLAGIDGFLWHWAQHETRDLISAIPILTSLELKGISVFPNHETCWHFDDKLAQSYLLESIGAPLVSFHALYSYRDVVQWASTAEWPQVFKLRRGAGSLNVRLLRSKSDALQIARKMFSAGMAPVEAPLSDLGTRLRKQGGIDGLMMLLKRSPQWARKYVNRLLFTAREKGYFYVQDFLPANSHDTRVAVIGGRAFAFRRAMRPGDFRASGSGVIDYDLDKIDLKCVKIALEVSDHLKTQSCAFDFLFNKNNEPEILEISFGFQGEAVHKCSGYWDRNLSFIKGSFWPQDLILDDLLSAIEQGNRE